MAARTYLELCQDAARQAGVTNTNATAAPLTVSNQVGELARVCDWVKKAWRRIQGRRRWNWMWEKASLTLAIGANEIAGTIPVSRYRVETAQRSTLTSDGLFLEYVPWDQWADWFSDAYIAAGNAPTVFTIRPDNAIVFNGKASLATTGGAMDFTIERYKNPTDLSIDGDVPGLPDDLDDAIVYKALVLYANFDEAGVTRAVAVDELARLERDLIARCLPEMRLGGPLGED